MERSDSMSKYFNLTAYLANMEEGTWEATFSDVEEVLGFPLPDSARKHRPWWANQGHAQSAAWLGAGYKTVNVDLENEKVTFLYVGDGVDREAPQAAKLSIAEAKAGLAAFFGVPVEAIEITIRG
jgi:hypothetical protein